jgi:hypothetical protein
VIIGTLLMRFGEALPLGAPRTALACTEGQGIRLSLLIGG